MDHKKTNTPVRGWIAAVAMAAFMTACNNEDTANNTVATDTSTTGATTIAPGTTDSNTVTGTTPSSTTTTTSVKRKGRVTAAIKADDETAKMQMDQSGYYNRAEVAPAYPGGQNSLENYIVNHIEYPQDAIDNNAEGTVYIQFGIDENGKVTNVKTTGSKLGYGLDEEAVRVVSNMPKWTPGQVKGKKVKTWRTLPISYKLES